MQTQNSVEPCKIPPPHNPSHPGDGRECPASQCHQESRTMPPSQALIARASLSFSCCKISSTERARIHELAWYKADFKAFLNLLSCLETQRKLHRESLYFFLGITLIKLLKPTEGKHCSHTWLQLEPLPGRLFHWAREAIWMLEMWSRLTQIQQHSQLPQTFPSSASSRNWQPLNPHDSARARSGLSIPGHPFPITQILCQVFFLQFADESLVKLQEFKAANTISVKALWEANLCGQNSNFCCGASTEPRKS